MATQQNITQENGAQAAAQAGALRESAMRPPMDIFETADSITLVADMPGVSREHLNLQIEGNTLVLEGTLQFDMAQHMEALYADVRSTPLPLQLRAQSRARHRPYRGAAQGWRAGGAHPEAAGGAPAPHRGARLKVWGRRAAPGCGYNSPRLIRPTPIACSRRLSPPLPWAVAAVVAVVAVVAVAALAAPVATATAPATSSAIAPAPLTVGRITLQWCPASGSWCATLPRPLDPTGAVAGTVPIYFEFYPHSAGGPSAGTLVAAEGGPGYPTTDSRDSYLALFAPLRTTRDVLLMDYRGTGRSGAVDCRELQNAPALTEANIGACGRLPRRARAALQQHARERRSRRAARGARHRPHRPVRGLVRQLLRAGVRAASRRAAALAGARRRGCARRPGLSLVSALRAGDARQVQHRLPACARVRRVSAVTRCSTSRRRSHGCGRSRSRRRCAAAGGQLLDFTRRCRAARHRDVRRLTRLRHGARAGRRGARLHRRRLGCRCCG